MPAPSDHAAHDPLLVAAHAAGDASGGDLARAAALLASCPDCARLHRDLRALPGALASAPVPARPRDFRLSPLQAESLRRPSGWRRLLAPLSGASSAAGPVAASLAALGVAGVLLGGGISLGAGGSATSDGAAGVPADASAAASSELAIDASGGLFTAGPGRPAGATSPDTSAQPSAAASSAPPAVPRDPSPRPTGLIDQSSAVAIARTSVAQSLAASPLLDADLGSFAKLGKSTGIVSAPSLAPDDLVWRIRLGYRGDVYGSGDDCLIDARTGRVIAVTVWFEIVDGAGPG